MVGYEFRAGRPRRPIDKENAPLELRVTISGGDGPLHGVLREFERLDGDVGPIVLVHVCCDVSLARG